MSLRVANVYDLNSKILLLKFAKPDTRHQLLIESGFRCHLTDFARTTAPAPSAFVARLRKFLKTRRVTAVSQIGTDRIIEFQFSDGAYRLYLEFFASGNIILTDSTLKILALLRNVPEGEGQEPQRVGLTYTLENRQNFGGVPPLSRERLRDALESTVKKLAADEAAGKKKSKKKGQDELRRGLATTITELPPVLVDHVFKLTSFDAARKPSEILKDDSLLDSLFVSLDKARNILQQVTSEATSKGYIVAKRRPDAPSEDGPSSSAEKAKSFLYEDFQPFLPKQFEDDPSCHILSFEGYNKTVDEFFSSLEGQRLESRLNEREAAAKRKLDAARQDQEKRIEGLQEAEMLNYRKAAAIEANVERVQEALDAVNGLLEGGMGWADVNKLVEREQRLQNAVAQLIKLPMNLSENTITLLLGEGEEEEEEKEDQLDFDYGTDDDVSDTEAEPTQAKAPSKCLEVEVNLGISPWNNAREYYEQKRTAADKAQKTVLQSTIALKNAEQKIAEDLKKGLKQEKPVLYPIRKQMWFEKFIWFISSDGYLVLGGRDAQQNEILYKRYLRKGDVYVHADLHGASSVIIKNNPKTPDAPIPPSTLAQAGSLSVCCSNAWDSKAAMGAWWVNADQVSKTAPTGEFLQVGSFMVRGKRNPLPPALLMLGFGIMFRISEESRAKHVGHRLYDVDMSEVGSSMTASQRGNTSGTGETETRHHDSDDSDSDDENERQERANPLQSHPRQTETTEDDVPARSEPPFDKLANLDLSAKEQHNSVDKGKSPQAPEEEDGGKRAEEEKEEDDESDEQPEEEKNPETASSSAPISRTNTPSATGKGPSKVPPKRGQRGKAKKIAAKYKDQDEEDRALMESLIGVTAGRQKAEAEAAAKAKREAEAAAALERRQKAQERAKKQIAEHEEVRKMMLEEGVELPLDESEVMELSPLDSLVGTPLVGDEILEAIPFCAPWSALTKVKYKAKLQPGNTKKGKAVKEIVERWRLAAGKKGVVDDSASDVEKMWPREVELIKGLKVEEAFNCVPVGKVTVMMSGGSVGGSGGGGGKGGGSSGGQGKGGKGGQGGKKR